MTDRSDSSTRRWVTALDALDRRVADASAALADGDVPRAVELAGALATPAGLPPLPPVLAERAREVLTGMTELAELLAQAQAELGRAIAATSKRRSPERSVPLYVDALG